MGKDTDYKRLYKNLKKENVILYQQLDEANRAISAYAKLIIKFKTGEIT